MLCCAAVYNEINYLSLRHKFLDLFRNNFFLLSQPVVDAVLDQIKRHEDFLIKMDQHDEKINHVINVSGQLISKEHYASDKIKDKTDSIKERYGMIFSTVTLALL